MAKLEYDEDVVRSLAQLLDDMQLSEIEYETGGHRIRVARSLTAAVPTAMAPVAAPVEVAASPAAAPAGEAAAPANAIKAPMVGTVYLAPEPGSSPFVSVGDRVREGQTLMIIEAMKVMNAIPCPRSGQVTQILVDDGQPVEYGEPLLVVE